MSQTFVVGGYMVCFICSFHGLVCLLGNCNNTASLALSEVDAVDFHNTQIHAQGSTSVWSWKMKRIVEISTPTNHPACKDKYISMRMFHIR